MTRENKYEVEINFESHDGERKIFTGQIPYYGSLSFKDDLSITNKAIIIKAYRSAKIQLDDIFYNHFSSLYNQIIKSLIYYYAYTRQFSKIVSVSVVRKRNEKIIEVKKFKENEFNQVLNNTYKLNRPIQNERLLELFQESGKGQTMLIATSYLISVSTDISENERFEKLWKAFNKLFKLIGNHNQDWDALRNLKEWITLHPGNIPLSSNVVTNIDTKTLRNTIRWRAMLLDNFDTEKKTGALKDFILRYSDKRIMEIISQTKYAYREDFLKNKKFIDEVDAHIDKHIKLNTKNDEEIVTFLTGKYMYFVRNKSFHGEKIDPSFRLAANKEDLELKFLNRVLQPYLIDLINCSDLY